VLTVGTVTLPAARAFYVTQMIPYNPNDTDLSSTEKKSRLWERDSQKRLATSFSDRFFHLFGHLKHLLRMFACGIRHFHTAQHPGQLQRSSLPIQLFDMGLGMS
jgi:hypothetical protein